MAIRHAGQADSNKACRAGRKWQAKEHLMQADDKADCQFTKVCKFHVIQSVLKTHHVHRVQVQYIYCMYVRKFIVCTILYMDIYQNMHMKLYIESLPVYISSIIKYFLQYRITGLE